MKRPRLAIISITLAAFGAAVIWYTSSWQAVVWSLPTAESAVVREIP